MKKVVFTALVLISLFSLFLIAGCSQSVPATTATANTNPSPSLSPSVSLPPSPSLPVSPAALQGTLPGSITFVTGPTTGSGYALSTIMADIIAKNTSMKGFLLPTPGMEFGQVDGVGQNIGQVGQITASTMSQAFNGESDFAPNGPRYWIRAIQAGRISPFAFIVRGDSGIKTMADLKGKRVATKYNEASTILFANAELRIAGLDPEKDIQVYSADTSAVGADLLANGRIDAYMTAIQTPYVLESVKTMGCYAVPFEKKDLDANLAKYLPGFVPYQISVPTYPAAPTERWVPGVVSINFVHMNMNDLTAYTLIKTIAEHVGEYTGTNKEIGMFGVDRARFTNTPVPYHPGAIQYLKEKGVWNSEMDAVQTKLIQQAQDAAAKAK